MKECKDKQEIPWRDGARELLMPAFAGGAPRGDGEIMRFVALEARWTNPISLSPALRPFGPAPTRFLATIQRRRSMFRPLSVFNRNDRQAPARNDAVAGDPFYRLQHEMNRLFDDAFAGFGLPSAFHANADDARAPRINVHESDDAVEIEAELPGVDEKDLDVEVQDNFLTIRGEKRLERKDEKEGEYRVMERSYGSFSRSMTLPFSVDPGSVEAVFKNGVLKLTLPKPAEARREARRISIRKG